MVTRWGTAKAIETVYKQHRFRSRLEARWAVFFDALGVGYEYEPEGFDLGGLSYLPDFWLPTQELWVEIKGGAPSGEESLKASRLAEATKCRVYMPFGDLPRVKVGWSGRTEVEYADDGGYVWKAGEQQMACCESVWRDRHGDVIAGCCADECCPDRWVTGARVCACPGPRVEAYLHEDNLYAWCECPQCGRIDVQFEARADRIPCACPKTGDRGHNGASARLVAAFNAAGRARFEHGER